jgi:surfeit locus 1 family protein
MRLFFRPLPKLTIAASVALALLIGLGVWQIHRLHWKLALIAEVNANLAAPPLPLGKALAMGSKAQYRRVALAGRFDNAHEAYVFTTGPDGDPVYHVVTPFLLKNGQALMVDRGYIPQSLRDPTTRAAGQLSGPQRIVGVWRVPDAPGWFTPPPDRKTRVWYARDVTAMAKAAHVTLAAPVIVEANAAPNPGGWPKGGQTIVHFRNAHLQYAITWFALAAGLVLVYLAYHRAQGRLGFR